MYNEYTPDFISELKENEIFVFGSNLNGCHSGGAARVAMEKFGAVWGQGVGLQGQSYAIPTMQGGVETIKPYVSEFYEFAVKHPEYKFLVTPIGCGIAGFTPEEIAPLFTSLTELNNVVLPKVFVDVLLEKSIFYSQRCLCTFVLDVSGSMAGDRINELNKALHTFYNEMLSDVTKKESLEISLITFSDVVTIVQRPALLEDIVMPELETGGSTALVDGVMKAIEVVTERKEWYKQYAITYYRPWIILVTDGTPNPEQDIESLSKKIKEDIYEKRYNFLPIGVGEGVDMDVLEYIKGNIPPMKLDSHGFSQFFRWLGASMGASIFDTTNLIDSNKLSAAKKNETIFISYKRQNKKTVFRIKTEIERATNESCWIDLDGIESDAQFANVIIEAINKCKVFLFMYSHEHQKIQDYDNDWTVREITFAQKKKKRIVFINIDGSPLTDWFELMFGSKQQIDASSKTLMDKLCSDLKKWLK